MLIIYYLVLACILAVGVFMAGVYWKQIVARYRKYRHKLKRNSLAVRVEQLEKRVELHTRKDGVYLNKFDEMEVGLQNVASKLVNKENNKKAYVKRIVREYLEELSK